MLNSSFQTQTIPIFYYYVYNYDYCRTIMGQAYLANDDVTVDEVSGGHDPDMSRGRSWATVCRFQSGHFDGKE